MTAVPDLVCFDVPSLIVLHPQVARDALDCALRRVDVEPGADLHTLLLSLGLRWPGEAARAALHDALGARGWADSAAAAFDDCFGASVGRRGATVADGAAACIAQLRALDARICLTTEFSASTREAILDLLAWPELVAMLLSPHDGVPGDELVSTALERTAVDPRHATVISATVAGVRAAARAGVADVVGVPGDVPTAQQLRAAGATRFSTLPQLAAEWASARLVPA